MRFVLICYVSCLCIPVCPAMSGNFCSAPSAPPASLALQLFCLSPCERDPHHAHSRDVSCTQIYKMPASFGYCISFYTLPLCSIFQHSLYISAYTKVVRKRLLFLLCSVLIHVFSNIILLYLNRLYCVNCLCCSHLPYILYKYEEIIIN